MPINLSGDSIFDGDCVTAKCEHWGGDGLCMMSMDYEIVAMQNHDINRSFWRHIGWKLNFTNRKYFGEWNISIYQHLKSKFHQWTPEEPKSSFCPLDHELIDDFDNNPEDFNDYDPRDNMM